MTKKMEFSLEIILSQIGFSELLEPGGKELTSIGSNLENEFSYEEKELLTKMLLGRKVLGGNEEIHYVKFTGKTDEVIIKWA